MTAPAGDTRSHTPDTSPPDDVEPFDDDQEEAAGASADGPQDADAGEPLALGTPAGQLAAGAGATVLVGGWALWELVGPLGLAVGGVTAAAGAGGYGYWRWRKAHPRRTSPASTTGGGGRGRGSPPPFRLGKFSSPFSRPGSRPGGRGSPPSGTSRRMTFGGPGRGGRPGTGLSALRTGPGSRTKRGGDRAQRRGDRTDRAGPAGRRVRFRDRGRPDAGGRGRGAFRPRLDGRPPGGRSGHRGPLRAAFNSARQRGRAINTEWTGATQALARSGARQAGRLWRWLFRKGRAWNSDTTEAGARLGQLAAALLRRHAATRAADAGADAEAAGAQPGTEPSPAAQPATSPAGDATPETTTEGSKRMTTANTFLMAAQEMPTAAAAWDTDDMMDMAAMADQLHEVPLAWATAFRIWAGKLMEEYPCHPDVVERIQDTYTAIARLGNDMTEVATLFRLKHEEDIARRLHPRRGEAKWNHR
ncbi:hypothetical protein ACIBG7_43385 [Nonomuraea sp. NPDC050328]|uniref:hypothetical protein n=1 Tax=Nonomuraea sp. NPDC050328 TaxID=3364361 RepID=UPI0037AB594B